VPAAAAPLLRHLKGSCAGPCFARLGSLELARHHLVGVLHVERLLQDLGWWCVCVCVCVCACVRACVCARARACVIVCVRLRARARPRGRARLAPTGKPPPKRGPIGRRRRGAARLVGEEGVVPEREAQAEAARVVAGQHRHPHVGAVRQHLAGQGGGERRCKGFRTLCCAPLLAPGPPREDARRRAAARGRAAALPPSSGKPPRSALC
jgi:hypothetical protein